MPDPTYFGSGNAAATATKDVAISPSLPVGAVAGQLALIVAVTSNFGAGAVAPTIPTPSGWTLLTSPPVHAAGFANNRNPRVYVFARILPASPTAPSLTMTGGSGETAGSAHVQAFVSTFNDAALADVLVLASAIGDTTAVLVPASGSPAAVRAGSLMLGITGMGNSNTLSGQTLGGVAMVEQKESTASTRTEISLATLTHPSATSPGAFAATFSAASPWGGYLIALQPPAPIDTTPPTISSRNPASGATGVSVASDVSVTFSEPMDSSTSGAFSVATTVGSVPVSGVLSAVGATWTLNPTSDLAYSTSYTATVTTAAKDVAGNALASTQSWTFTTQAAPAGSALTAGALVDHERWAFDVCDRAGNVLAQLYPLSVSITKRLNGVGEMQMVLDPASPGVDKLDSYRVVRAHRRPSIYTGRSVAWLGDVHALTDVGDADGSERVELTARDPMANVLTRFMWTNNSFGPGSLSDAVNYLIGDAAVSEETGAPNPVTYPHGISVVVPVGAGWPTSTWAWARHEPIAEAFRAMQEGDVSSQGFYWVVKANTLWIALVPDHLSAVWNDDRTARFAYGPGTDQNVAGYSVERVPPVNSVIAVGKEGLTVQNDSESSAAAYGLWPVLASYGDVDTTARLDALARGVWHVWPHDAISLTLLSHDDPDRPLMPRMWDHFDIGQTVPVLIRGARRTISGSPYVREATVEIDADGVERVSRVVLDLPGTS